MGRDADTHIRVTDETWTKLNSRKKPGDSFNDVIARLLEEDDDDRASAETDGGEPLAAFN